MPLSASDLLCRVLMFSSLAFWGNNTATIELSTPHNVAPTNVVFCSLDADQVFQADRVQLLSVTEGGGIFQLNETRRVPGASLADEAAFLSGSTREHAIHLLSPTDFLGSDPYFKRPPASWGTTVDGNWPLWLMLLPPTSTSNSSVANFSSSSSASSSNSSSSSTTAAASSNSTQQLPVVTERCIRIQARWKAFTRYQISFRYTNRPPPKDASTVVTPPRLWVTGATEQQQRQQDTKRTKVQQQATQSPTFVVRGDKAGQVCSLRPAAAQNLTRMFDACAQAAKDGVLPANRVATLGACVKLLQLRRANFTTPPPFPYNVVPVAPISIDDFNVTGLPAAANNSSSNSSSSSNATSSNATTSNSYDYDTSYSDDYLDSTAQPATVGPVNGARRLHSETSACTVGGHRQLRQSSSSPCPAGSLLGPRLGGECIQCGNGVAQGSACQCFPGYAPLASGPVACGAPLSTLGNVTDSQQLATLLCSTYSAHQRAMMQGQLADRVVQSFYLAAFVQQASLILDMGYVIKSNATFWDQYVTDERNPGSPTRRTGIGPNCNRCEQGMFTDVISGKQVPVRDDRFRAVNTFRLIGYLLAGSGFPCAELWDPANPLEWKYGPYLRKMCMTTLDGPS